MSEVSSIDPRVFDALLRSDLSSFIQRTFATLNPGTDYHHNWHIDAMAHSLSQVESGEISRLIITMPPRTLKSLSASVAFPAWYLGRDPTRRVIAVSYGESLSDKFAEECRQVMMEPWYRSAFPYARLKGNTTARADFQTKCGGGRYSTSIGGALTGRGGSLILLDDPHKPEEVTSDTKRRAVIEWFGSTLLSRLDDPRSGAIVLIQQRLHDEDLAGFLLDRGGWTHLNLPAIAQEHATISLGRRQPVQRRPGDLLHPYRLTQAYLDDLKGTIGSFRFSAQYQQSPAPTDGGFVTWSWFPTYKTTPTTRSGDQIIQSWDTANKAEKHNDYSACTTWLTRGREAWLLRVDRYRLEFPALRQKIASQAKNSGARAILIEEAGSGVQLIQDLKRDLGCPAIACRPDSDKATRLMSVTPMIEAGDILIPEDASWLADFKTELLRFPYAKHDDQVDSLSQFLRWFSNKRRRGKVFI